MKNLVLSTLIVAAASQAAGCIIVDDDPTTGEVRLSWALKSTNAAGDPIPAGCPAGGDTATLFALPSGANPADAYQDKYDCSAGTGYLSDLPRGAYTVWLQITDFGGGTKFAESFSEDVQVVDGGTTSTGFDVYVDRAFFAVGWNLTGGISNCNQVPDNRGVAITATDSGGGLFETLVDCEVGIGRQIVSDPVPSSINGTAIYTIVLSLLDRNEDSIGDSVAQPNKRLDYGNELENLGILNIPVR